MLEYQSNTHISTRSRLHVLIYVYVNVCVRESEGESESGSESGSECVRVNVRVSVNVRMNARTIWSVSVRVSVCACEQARGACSRTSLRYHGGSNLW